MNSTDWIFYRSKVLVNYSNYGLGTYSKLRFTVGKDRETHGFPVVAGSKTADWKSPLL